MTNDKVTLRDVYEAINDLRQEMGHRMERIEADVDENTNFRNQLIGKITVLFAIIGIGINFAWDYIFNRK